MNPTLADHRLRDEHYVCFPDRMVTPRKVQGTPDLLVEILSPSTRENDMILKRQRYEAAGVPEYWIVAPFEHTLEQLILTNGSYVAREHDDIVTVFDDVSVYLGEVW